MVFYRVQAGESCAISTACLLDGLPYLADGIAETHVQALMLPHRAFHECLAHSEPFRRFVFCQYARRLGDLMSHIESITSERIGTRIARYLAARMVDGSIAITHEQLATDIGSAREVVSRNLKNFERHGWIRLGRSRIDILDTTSLRSVSS